jgi:RNA polymerase sigma factor for flagellar operon FliA
MLLPPNILPEDLMSAGVIGLIDAINKFDPQKNVQFKIYARYRIKGAMWDELRALDWVPRSIRRKKALYTKVCQNLQNRKGEPAEDEEIAQEFGLPLSKYYCLINEINCGSIMNVENLDQESLQSMEKDSAGHFLGLDEDPFYLVSLKERKKVLSRAIETLSHGEKIVISLYYFEELTLRQIGKILSLTESRVSQIHRKAIAKLGAICEKIGFEN